MVTRSTKDALLCVLLGLLLCLTACPDTGWCQESQEEREAKVHADFNRAIALYNQGKVEQARDLFIDVKNSGVYLGFFKNRDLHNYLMRVEEQLRKKPSGEADAVAAKFDRAKILYKEKRYPEAKRLFEDVRDSNVNLGFFKMRELKSYLARVDDDIRKQRMKAGTAEVPAKPAPKPAAPAPKAVKPPEKAPEAVEAERAKQEQMVALYDKGTRLFEEERWAEARDVFQQVADSGVDLGWWRNRSLQSKLLTAKRRAEQKAAEGAPAARPGLVQVALQKGEMVRKLNKAGRLFKAGRYDEAALLYQEIKASNVDLGADTNRKVVENLEAALAESRKARAARVSPEEQASRLLDEMRREKRVRGQKNKALADHYAAVGERFYNQQAYAKAKEQFEKALRLLPGHARAARLLQKTEAFLGIEPERFQTQANRLAEEKAVQIQQKKFEMENKLREGVALLKAKRYDAALETFETTAIIINRLRRDIDVSAYEDHLNSLIELATRSRERQGVDMAKTRRKEAAKQARADEVREQALSEEKIQKLYEQAYSAFLKEKYEDTVRTCRDILYEDPNNSAVEALMERAKIEKEKKFWSDHRKKDVEEHEKNAQYWEKLTIPMQRVEEFPDREEWERISQRDPVAVPQATAAMSDYEKKLDRALDERRVDISFESTPILDVVNFLRTLVEMNIILHSDVAEDTTITLDLKNVSLRAALNNICMLGDLDYSIKKEAVWITTKETAAEMITLVYDIRDLLLAVIDRPRRPQILGESASSGGGGGLDFGGGGGGQSSGGIARDSRGRDVMDVELQVRGQQFVKFLVHVTGADKWAAMPAYIIPQLPKGDDDDLSEGIEGEGEAGRVVFRDGDLLIKQTSAVHKQIREILSKLRRSLYLQVQIDCRFMYVQDDFREEVGTQIQDLALRSDGRQLLNPGTATSPSYPSNPTYMNRWARPTRWSTGLGANAASGSLFGISNPFNSTGAAAAPFIDTNDPQANVMGDEGLNLGLAFLSELQATFLIKAAQRSDKADVMDCPRLTVFNTQRANVSVGESVAYIQDLDVGNQGTLDPEISSVTNRTSLDVRPIVSADRRFVYLEVMPERLRLNEPPGGLDQSGNPLRFRRTEIQTDDTSGTVQHAYIEMPEQTFEVVETTVIVPDRGHLLLGGMAEGTKQERQIGVPVLNKIPVLKRLFSRHGTVAEKQHLLILINPTILIQDEVMNDAVY